MQSELPNTKWWVEINGQREGPFSTDEVILKLKSALVSNKSFACPVDGDEWKTLSSWGGTFSQSKIEMESTSPTSIPKSVANGNGEMQDSKTDGDKAQNQSIVVPEDNQPNSECESIDSRDELTQKEGYLLLGVAIVVLAGCCYFWFYYVLWVLMVLSAFAAFVCGVVTIQTIRDETPNEFAFGTVFLSILSFCFWYGIQEYGIVIPSLSSHATAKEITQAYRDRVAHIQIAFKSERSRFWGSSILEGGGTGSGLLIANDKNKGVIITNRHVIDPIYFGSTDNVTSIDYSISLASEISWYEANVAAVHNDLDLAILIVEKKFPRKGAVRIASALTLEQGDEVVALGNPIGEDFVTTEGIISKSYENHLVTSCPINPGNSGGPLISKNGGLVVGFNTWGREDLQNWNGAVLSERVFHEISPSKDPASKGNSLVKVAVSLIGNAIVGPPSSIEVENWTWTSDQETITELLRFVKIEYPD